MEDFGVIILAGGKSSRMGEDKGLMALFGKPMIAYVLDKAMEMTTDIIIVSNNSNYKKFGYPVYKDQYKEKGPLVGIFTGLMKSTHETNIILSCDIPYVKTELLQFLLKQSDGFDITVPSHNARIHPLVGVYKKSCAEKFKDCVDKGNLKITDSFVHFKTKIVETDEFDDIEFKNLNSKNDIIPI